MSFHILYTPGYNKKAAKFLKKHPELLSSYVNTLRLLELDPFHPALRLHRRKGRLSELHSASINISYRITLELVLCEDQIIPVGVGSHDDVYR